jgi:hypothetical protein
MVLGQNKNRLIIILVLLSGLLYSSAIYSSDKDSSYHANGFCGAMFSVFNNSWHLDSSFHHKGFYMRTEYNYQKHHYLSVGLGYIDFVGVKDVCTPSIFGLRGFTFNTDLKLDSKFFNIIPKISYEYNFLFIGTKLSSGIITDFKQTNFLISPELGLTGFGYWYIFYGYNFLLKDRFDIKGNKLVVGFCFPISKNRY